jgi:Na+/melibiose symporter-like transporter
MQQLGIQVTLTFLNFFMTNFLLMTPLVVAAVLSFGRLIDMGMSLIAGSILQKSNLKTGPFRTHILINGPLLAIGNFFIFLNPNVSEQAKLVVFMIGYLFRNLPQNFLIAGQQALIAKMAGSNQAFRLAITAKNSQGVTVAGILTSMTVIPLVTYFNNQIGNGRGYLITAMLLCAIHSVVGLISYIGLKEFDKYDPDAKKVEGSAIQTKLTHVYTDTVRNPYVWVLFLRGLLAQVGTFTMYGLNAYFFTYSLGNINFMALNNTIGSWLGLGVVILAPQIAKRLGKKRSVLIAALSSFLVNCTYAVFAHGNFPLFLTMSILNRIFMGPSSVIGVNQWIDAADYQYYKTGRDSRPFIMSLSTIGMKVGQLLSSFTYAWVLIFCNFVSLGQGQVEMDVPRLVLGMFGFQAIQTGISLLIYVFCWW